MPRWEPLTVHGWLKSHQPAPLTGNTNSEGIGIVRCVEYLAYILFSTKMSIPTSLQNLQPLPLRAIDDKSVFPEGRFVVSAPVSSDDNNPLVVGQTSEIVRKTWFKSPVRFFKLACLGKGADNTITV